MQLKVAVLSARQKAKSFRVEDAQQLYRNASQRATKTMEASARGILHAGLDLHKSSVRRLNSTREQLYINKKSLTAKSEALKQDAKSRKMAATVSAVMVAQKLRSLVKDKVHHR